MTARRPATLPLPLALLLAAVVGVLAYVVWFGASDPIDADYATWQWVGGAATFGAGAAVLGLGQRMLIASLVLPVVTTAAWFRHAWSEDESGLSVVGIPVVLVITVALGAGVGGLASYVAERRAR